MLGLRTELCERQVHVYWANLDDPCWLATPATMDDLFLSSDERLRASRFRFERDRRRYVLSHLVLRKLIADYIAEPAGALVFQYSSHGKPRLAHNSLHFNLSHSNGIGVFALASTEVGVDTEHASAESFALQVAHMYLSSKESNALDSLPEIERKRACLRIWTRKEALLKGIGTGLMDDLCNVLVGWPKPSAIVHPFSSNYEEPWVIRDIGPFQGAAGALAYRHRDSRVITCREFVLSPGGRTVRMVPAMPRDVSVQQEFSGV